MGHPPPCPTAAFDLLDLGRMSYQPCADLQRRLLDEVADRRRKSTLLFVEHEPVLTLGANFHEQNLLLRPAEYEERGIEVVRTDRGGDVTYHGPGQLVIYPIFDVARFGKDLHRWLRDLEETMILTCASVGLEAGRKPPHTGAWVGDRKIAAIGIKVRRWVNMHGIALNCDNDLGAFETIIPCGIERYGVTSLSIETGRTTTLWDAKPMVADAFAKVFTTIY